MTIAEMLSCSALLLLTLIYVFYPARAEAVQSTKTRLDYLRERKDADRSAALICDFVFIV